MADDRQRGQGRQKGLKPGPAKPGLVSPLQAVITKASVKLSLYEGVATGQLGVKAKLDSDFWGYWGNTCGVGNADAKNPPGQLPGGTDANAGYECDWNQGVGQTNPAHRR